MSSNVATRVNVQQWNEGDTLKPEKRAMTSLAIKKIIFRVKNRSARFFAEVKGPFQGG